jgi:hypothetical protein
MMSRPLLFSLGMHALFAVIAVFGLPMLGRDLPEEMPIVRLEIVRKGVRRVRREHFSKL